MSAGESKGERREMGERERRRLYLYSWRYNHENSISAGFQAQKTCNQRIAKIKIECLGFNSVYLDYYNFSILDLQIILLDIR